MPSSSHHSSGMFEFVYKFSRTLTPLNKIVLSFFLRYKSIWKRDYELENITYEKAFMQKIFRTLNLRFSFFLNLQLKKRIFLSTLKCWRGKLIVVSYVIFLSWEKLGIQKICKSTFEIKISLQNISSNIKWEKKSFLLVIFFPNYNV